MKLGRNDPCSCGSGKKYKHCCLLTVAFKETAPEELLWRRVRRALEEFPHRILSFIDQTYGAMAINEALDEFFLERDFDLESDRALLQLFMPWFFHCWSPDVDTQVPDDALQGVPPTAAFIARRRKQLDPSLVRYLESCLQSPVSFYDVLRCVPGERIFLRDIFTGEEHDVIEHQASGMHEPGDIVVAQLAHVDGITMIEAYGSFAIPPQAKAQIVKLRAHILGSNERITSDLVRDYDFEVLDLFLDLYERAFYPAPPELQNTDGEPFSLRKLVYDLEVPPQAAFDALKHLALDEPEDAVLEDAERDGDGTLKRVSFAWKKKGNATHAEWENTILGHVTIEGKRLTAEVNSEARADHFADLVAAALGADAQFRVTRVIPAEEMLSRAREQAQADAQGRSAEADEVEALNRRPEVRALMAEKNAAHFERWPDMPLPILDGRTPHEAVADPDGREVVEALLTQFERDTIRSGQPTDPAVFVRLRQRLGLPRAPD